MVVEYLQLSEVAHLPELDFTEKDGSDPLGIHKFYYDDLQRYQESNLSTVRLVKIGDKIVGYFTVSMNAIELDKLGKDEKVKNTTPRKYPAMLIGRMGIDKKYRRKGIGSEICQFCRGLAIEIGQKVACRYVILHTTDDRNKIRFYNKSGFIKSGNPPKQGVVSMFVRTI